MMATARSGHDERMDSVAGAAWFARVVVTPKPGVNDPEGEAILGGLSSLGFDGVERVRSGRYFELTVRADDAGAAESMVDEMCRRLLANPVIETYRFTVDERGAAGSEPGGRR